MRFLLSLLIIFGGPLAAGGQATVTGKIYDAATREPLSFAHVSALNGQESTYADELGKFVFHYSSTALSADRDSLYLRVSYVGYGTDTLALALPVTRLIDVPMQSSLNLPLVEVSVSRQRSGGSVVTPSLRTLDATPQLGGERDYLKALTLLPGISTSIEGTANLQIRGGSADQTLLLLDGTPLFYVNHAGGFLSGIPEYGMKSITVYKGGVPARMGGRLSGVVDVLLREGDRDRWRGEVSIGTISSRFGADGPVGKNGSLLLSGRFGYPALLVDAITGLGNFEEGVSGSKTNVTAFDGLAKYVYTQPRYRISAKLFSAGDAAFLQDDFASSINVDRIRWNNSMAGLTYDYDLDQRTTWENSLAYSRYTYRYKSAENLLTPDRELAIQNSLISQASIGNVSLQSSIERSTGNSGYLSAGVTLQNHLIASSTDTQNDTGSGIGTERLFDNRNGLWEGALFVNHEGSYRNGRFRTSTGLRLGTALSSGTGQNFTFARLEPRLRLTYRLLPDLFFNAGFDVHTQYIHQLIVGGGALPNDIWITSDASVPPSRSRQWYVGLEGNQLWQGRFQWSIEAFDKQFSDLLTLERSYREEFNLTQDWRDATFTGGTGRAYGLEFSLSSDPTKRFSGSLAYTWSRSDRRFAQLNEGNSFPFTYDRRHDLAVAFAYRGKKGWSFNAHWIYQTGHAVSLPTAVTPDFFVYPSLNNARMPNYHRADLSLTKSWRPRRNSENSKELSFSLFNAYNRSNPYQLRFQPGRREFIDPNTGELTTGYFVRTLQRSLFPLVPGISYRIRYGR